MMTLFSPRPHQVDDGQGPTEDEFFTLSIGGPQTMCGRDSNLVLCNKPLLCCEKITVRVPRVTV